MADEQQKPEFSKRKKIQMERMARVNKARAIGRVRVSPRDDEVRAWIKHPRVGAFRSVGSIEWPNDTFTQRRIRDGTVTLEPPREAAPSSPTTSRASVSTTSSAT
jgi:hypothetical protein